MTKALSFTLGVLTAIGGFLDIGELVTGSLAGARFGMSLVWVVILGVGAIMLYSQMSARIGAATGRAAFDVVRDRMGPRVGLANLLASFLVNVLTLGAEIGGVALSLELAADVSYFLWIPLVGFAVWFIVWRVPYQVMERIYGLLGLTLLVLVVAVVRLHPDWGALWHGATHPTVPKGEGHATWWYFAVAIFGAATEPYEIFFYSSGAIEEKWTKRDLAESRVNVLVGFPLGAVLMIALITLAHLVLQPANIQVNNLGQAALPVAVAAGKVGLAFAIFGFVIATFGAALEVTLASGYIVAQYFGWSWGKLVKPRDANRFHVVVLLTLVAGTALVLTTIDPVMLTEYSVVLSAVALPLTYFPVLVAANDRRYLGDLVNGRLTNVLGVIYLVIITAAALAAIPLLFATKAGQ